MARFTKHLGFYKEALTIALYWIVLILFVFKPPALPVSGNLALAILLFAGLPIQIFSGRSLWRNANAEANELAFKDELTGLKNRRGFMNRAEPLFDRAASGSLSLLVLDVDGLKTINDECGHLAGDEALRQVASKLKELSFDAFRIGGDEFTVLVDRSRHESMSRLLQRLKPIEHTFNACGHDHVIEFCCGFASLQPEESFEAVFRRADTQMRQRKARLYESGQIRERRGSSRILETEFSEEISEALPEQIVPITRGKPGGLDNNEETERSSAEG